MFCPEWHGFKDSQNSWEPQAAQDTLALHLHVVRRVTCQVLSQPNPLPRVHELKKFKGNWRRQLSIPENPLVPDLMPNSCAALDKSPPSTSLLTFTRGYTGCQALLSVLYISSSPAQPGGLNTLILQMRQLRHATTLYAASDRTPWHHPKLSHALPHPVSSHRRVLLTSVKWVPWNYPLLSVSGTATFVPFAMGGQYGLIRVPRHPLLCSQQPIRHTGLKTPRETWALGTKPRASIPVCGARETWPRPSPHRPSSPLITCCAPATFFCF